MTTIDDRRPPSYSIRVHTQLSIEQAGAAPREHLVRHVVTRHQDGSWDVETTRDGMTTRFSGDGDVPALIAADGVAIIVVQGVVADRT